MLDAARGVAEGSDYDTTLEEIVVTYGGTTHVESTVCERNICFEIFKRV